MSNQSSKSKSKNSLPAEKKNVSDSVKTNDISSAAESTSTTDQGNDTKQISLAEKTRFGFVSDRDAHSSLKAKAENAEKHIAKKHIAEKSNTSRSEPLVKVDALESGTASATNKLSQSGVTIENSAGALLRYHRERLKFTQQDVAIALKTRLTTVSDLEYDRLAQETAVKFATQLLINYANFLGIDPDEVLALYNRKVEAMIKANIEPEETKKPNHAARNILIIILILVVAGCGYFIFGGDSSSSQDNGVSGELTVDGSELQAGMDLSNESNAGERGTIDSNMLQSGTIEVVESAASAQSQAALQGTKNSQQDAKQDASNAKANSADSKQSASLPLREESIKNQQQREVAQASQETKAKAEAQKQSDATKAQAGSKNAQDKQGASTSLVTTAASNSDNEKSSDKNADTKAADTKAESKEATPSLNKSLTDISNNVKIVDRDDGLSSLNNVEVVVLDDVALEIKASDKVIKSGVFKAGEVIKVTSIPPFVISVSDTAAIRVKYLEGVLKTPNAKQVTFKLPSR